MNNIDKANIAVSLKGVSKKFKLYDSNKDRVKEFFHPLRDKYHHEYCALTDINITAEKGNAIAVLGRNGSGKSTLLQIIASVMQPTVGSIFIDGKVSALLELGAGFNPLFTGRDNVILSGVIQGISEKDMICRLPEIEDFADIGEFFYQPVGTYSTGMFVRLAFAVATSLEPDIILIDEALAVGDAKFQHKCFNKIQGYVKQGKTLFIVSHDTETILRLCNQGIVLNNSEIVFNGEIAKAVNIYQGIIYGNHNTNKVEKSIDKNVEAILSQSLFSDEYEDKCYEKPNYNQNEIRLGDKRVIIIDYNVIIDGNLNPPVINHGELFKIIMKVLFTEDIEGVHFGFAITTKDGVYVYGTNTEMQCIPPANGEKDKVSIVEFSGQALFVGNDYFINLGVFKNDSDTQEYLDVRRSLIHVKINETPWCNGLVALNTKINIKYD